MTHSRSKFASIYHSKGKENSFVFHLHSLLLFLLSLLLEEVMSLTCPNSDSLSLSLFFSYFFGIEIGCERRGMERVWDDECSSELDWDRFKRLFNLCLWR